MLIVSHLLWDSFDATFLRSDFVDQSADLDAPCGGLVDVDYLTSGLVDCDSVSGRRMALFNSDAIDFFVKHVMGVEMAIAFLKPAVVFHFWELGLQMGRRG